MRDQSYGAGITINDNDLTVPQVAQISDLAAKTFGELLGVNQSKKPPKAIV